MPFEVQCAILRPLANLKEDDNRPRECKTKAGQSGEATNEGEKPITDVGQ